MSVVSKIQIIKVDPLQDKEFEGRKYQIQEAHCITLNDDGSVGEVAILRLGDKMRGAAEPKCGYYSATFALKANPKDRRLGAVLTGLVPFEPARVKA